MNVNLPTRQTMISAKRQLQIRRRLASLHLAPRPWLPSIPIDTLTIRIARLHSHRAPRKPISEEITHVVPDLIEVIEVVCEDGLADVGLKDAALSVGELEGDAAGNCRSCLFRWFAGHRWNRRRTTGIRVHHIDW
jgi:hypothetical protein